MASLLFGSEVAPGNVIGETVRRSTSELDFSGAAVKTALRESVEQFERLSAADYTAFVANPLSAWIEAVFGVSADPVSGRLVRAMPRPLRGDQGAVGDLVRTTGLSEELCTRAIQHALLTGYQCKDPDTDKPVFAFRLHQFISRGDTAYASLEAESDRYITLAGQQFVPGNRDQILLPLVFCRECGQEYYSVYRRKSSDGGVSYSVRDYMDRLDEEDAEAGFLFSSTTDPWEDESASIERGRIPDAWVEEFHGDLRVGRNLPEISPTDRDGGRKRA